MKSMMKDVPGLLVLMLLIASTAVAQVQRDEPLRPAWCQQLPRPAYKSLARVESADPWFEVYRVSPGVFAIYEPHQFEEVISYLILGQKKALLLDTGLGVGNISRLVARLTTLPVTVLNSHTHYDHVGGNADFERILGVDSEYSRKNAAGAVNQYGAWDALSPDRLCGKLPQGVTRETYKIRPWKIAETVHDGEVLDLGERQLQILLTPGHTPDSLMLLDRKNKVLFTGDMFYPGPIYLYTPETSLSDYRKSIERVSELVPQLDLLLTSHNVPKAEPQILLRLREAFLEVQARRVKPVSSEGYLEYQFQGVSLVMATVSKASAP